MIDERGLRALAAAVILQCLADARCPHTPARREQARAWLLSTHSPGRTFWCAAADLPEMQVIELAKQTLLPTTTSSRRAA